jgi:riboflavin synthase
VFTGLVEAMGTVASTADAPAGRRLAIDLPDLLASLEVGDSVAVNGCCLTVTALGDRTACFEVGPETLRRTNLGRLEAGRVVNLERAVAAGARMGGHFVQGHVDGVGAVRSRRREGECDIVWFDCGDLAGGLVTKGSVAVDGVSLTVCEVDEAGFSVMLLPYSLAKTTLGSVPIGEAVNVETDVLGKYVLRALDQMLSQGRSDLVQRLRAAGILE